jgi:hypothetical protein
MKKCHCIFPSGFSLNSSVDAFDPFGSGLHMA